MLILFQLQQISNMGNFDPKVMQVVIKIKITKERGGDNYHTEITQRGRSRGIKFACLLYDFFKYESALVILRCTCPV